MAFKPINPKNAILEASVMVCFNRPVFDYEAEAIRLLHSQFEADFPKLEAVPMNAVLMGPMLMGVMPPSDGSLIVPGMRVAMTSYRRDGSLETRLILNGPLLAVNFLTYTRWTEIRPKAVAWVCKCLDALTAARRDQVPPLLLSFVTHQMVDVFKWEGSTADLSMSHLMVADVDRIPAAAQASVGDPWFAAHSYSTPHFVEDMPDGNLLDFISFDLSEEESFGWRMRIEHTLEMRFRPNPPYQDVFTVPRATTLLDRLHSRNQGLFREIIQPPMLVRIGIGDVG